MYNKIDKEKFDFVNVDERIFDAKFEGKPRTFLKDAMIRFVKNKVNVVASTIVLMVLLLSALVPVLTTKDYSAAMNSNAKFLPPRIPGLEKLGIFDGTIKVNSFQADLTHYDLIDASLGDVEGNRLYYPLSDEFNKFDPKYIKSGTLTNNFTTGVKKDPRYIGGFNDFVLDKHDSHIIGYIKDEYYSNATLTFSIDQIGEGGIFDVYIRPFDYLETLEENEVDPLDPTSLDYYLHVGTIEEEGIHEINVSETIYGSLVLVYTGESKSRLSFSEIKIKYDSKPQPLVFSGYELSQWQPLRMDTFGGSWSRRDALYTSTNFTYYKYNDIFANRERTISNVDYDQFLAENPELADSIIYNDPDDHSKGWKFGEEGEHYYVEVLYQTTPIKGPDGKYYFNYRVVINGLLDSGYKSLPYFIFGTDTKGRDLFAEVWLSLRTSLILGLIVSAINIVLGIVWGSISGYFGGRVDFYMERFVEVLSSFPGLTVLTILYLKFGGGFALLLIYLTYAGWVGVAGMTRIQFYRYRGREYVLASRTLGAGHARLIFKHILPNSIGYIITSVVLSVPSMILTEASLSYLGFGLGEGATLNLGLFKLSGLSLGILLKSGQDNMTAPGRFYLVLIPSIVIIIIMIAFNLFGNALRDAMNPSLRGQE